MCGIPMTSPSATVNHTAPARRLGRIGAGRTGRLPVSGPPRGSGYARLSGCRTGPRGPWSGGVDASSASTEAWGHVYREVVPPPTSRRQIDRLGQRIAESGYVGDDDRALYANILDYYQDLLDAVCDSLTEIGLTPTSRVKTTGTLVEKLQRDQGMQFSRIQDVAGARVVLDGNRSEQDALVKNICSLFLHFPRKPDVIDRRASPTHGYRAVHVIAYPDSFPVEIQVRTYFQDIWAQIFERIADQWGRQIRYGEPPDLPSPEGKTTTKHELATEVRRTTVDLLMQISRFIDLVEIRRAKERHAQELLEHAMSIKLGFTKTMLVDLPESEATDYMDFRHSLIRHLALVEEDKRKRGRLIRRKLPKDRVDAEKCREMMELIGSQTLDPMLAWVTHQEEVLRKMLNEVSQTFEIS